MIYSDSTTFIINEPGYCGIIYPNTYTNSFCSANITQNFNNAVYDLIGADESVQTFTGYIQGVNINNAPYTLQLNADWLVTNNLSYTGSSIVIDAFDPIYGYPINSTNLSFNVETTNTTVIPDYVLNNAHSYGVSSTEFAYVYFNFYDLSCSVNPNMRCNLTFPSILIPDLTGLSNPTVVGNVLSYDVTSPWNHLYFYMPGTTLAGTLLDFSITLVDNNALETNLTNNSLNFQGIVYNSYDPNDKLVNKPSMINPMEQEELTYTIHFQNEGNFPANKVVIKDTLDSNLDLSTFEFVHSKHNIVRK